MSRMQEKCIVVLFSALCLHVHDSLGNLYGFEDKSIHSLNELGNSGKSEYLEGGTDSLREIARRFYMRNERKLKIEEIQELNELVRSSRVKWFELSRSGDSDAQYLSSIVYSIGLLKKRDEEKSISLLRQAAEAKHPYALFELGLYLHQKAKGPDDFEEAFGFLLAAAEMQVPVAQLQVGLCYRSGQGVEPDDAQAIKWYQLAAIQGNANAQYNLGCAYQRGRGVKQDDSKAVGLFTAAAKQGLREAQYNLGVCYRDGTGCNVIPTLAVHYFHLAAEQGMENACVNLLVSYRDGVGVAKDADRATYWRYRSEGLSHDSALFETYERRKLAKERIKKMLQQWEQEDQILDDFAEREANERAYSGR